jgi:hypothetical protein
VSAVRKPGKLTIMEQERSLGSAAAIDLHSQIALAVFSEQPYLEVSIVPEGVLVEGHYLLIAHEVADRSMGPMSRHKVAILTPWDYPETEPVVTMRDRSLPRGPDHHIASDGECCITAFPTWRLITDDRSWAAYFEGPIRNFFLSHLVRRRTGRWPFGEYAHGGYGLVQAISEILECPPDGKFVRGILCWRRRQYCSCLPPDHHSCPCRSGRTIGRCCGDHLLSILHKIPQEDARTLLAAMDRRPRNAPLRDINFKERRKFMQRNRFRSTTSR